MAGSFDEKVPPLPIIAWSGTVQPDWIDDNQHMTALAYPNLFHPHTGALFRAIGIDRRYMADRKLSIFQREFRLGYDRELLLGDPIEIRSYLLAHDAKRVHHFHELWHTGKGYRAAFIEYMSLHVDLSTRRTAPFPSDVMSRLDALVTAYREEPRPSGYGKAIGIPAPRPVAEP
jgi:acyl-CoA thioester hydrolase